MPALNSDDTIAAIASPPGAARRGIVRLSGPRAIEIATSRFTPDDPVPSSAHVEHRLGTLVVTGLRNSVATRLVVWPNRSFTGQPSAELHTLGTLSLLESVLADCLAAGARPAERGEFTLRAFLSGRIDLTQAEAVLGVIEARDASQLASALDQLGGGVAAPIEQLRDRLLDVLAHMEANLDFADESDVDPLGRSILAAELMLAASEVHALAERLSTRDRPEGRARVVLIGPPNAGKSRLFNAMTDGIPALVSSEPGTTRDYLVGSCQCGDRQVDLVDTSGIEEARDEIEALAHAVRGRQVEVADLVLICSPFGSDECSDERDHDRPTLVVRTKLDLATGPAPTGQIATSAATGQGLIELRKAIASALGSASAGEGVAGTSARCRDALVRAGESLQSASAALTLGAGDELVAIDLRQTLDDLGRVVGAIVTDDVLDRVFRRFCIGK